MVLAVKYKNESIMYGSAKPDKYFYWTNFSNHIHNVHVKVEKSIILNACFI